MLVSFLCPSPPTTRPAHGKGSELGYQRADAGSNAVDEHGERTAISPL